MFKCVKIFSSAFWHTPYHQSFTGCFSRSSVKALTVRKILHDVLLPNSWHIL